MQLCITDPLPRCNCYLVFTHTYLLLHDSASVHSTLSVQKFVANNGMTDIPHHLYSPDLPYYDFLFFHDSS